MTNATLHLREEESLLVARLEGSDPAEPPLAAVLLSAARIDASLVDDLETVAIKVLATQFGSPI